MTKFKITVHHPQRHELNGMSYSELKTLLKRSGHKFPRQWAITGFVTRYQDRMYRFRWWSETADGFVVDISCPINEFDRWANSCDHTVTFEEWKLL